MVAEKREASPRRAARRDPRAEPESPLPAGVVEEVAPRVRRDPRAESEHPPAEPAAAAPAPHEEPEAREPEAREPTPPPPDPRFAELEPLIARNAWGDIAERLGKDGDAGTLPPALALVYALARRESAGEASSPGSTELAIRSMAELVGVPPQSGMALVLAKRLLRQNPAGWRHRPAPPPRLSAAIIIIGVLAGAAVGWFVNFGSLRLF